MTNEKRADRAFEATWLYTDFEREPASELPTYVGDMLANIMHLCRRQGIDFEDVLRIGRDHFDAEITSS